MTTDTVFAEPLQSIERFEFDDRVASVFDDMIERSVPGYRSIVLQTGLLAARYSQPGSACYDLGCSLGASALAMQSQLALKPDANGYQLIAVDNSHAMLKRLHQRLATAGGNTTPRIDTINADIATLDFAPCSVAVLNFTLQFFPPNNRDSLIQRIASAMLPGGVLVLSEKIRFEDQQQQQLHTTMYERFKRSNGYSELEICQKREALENVLLPETLASHKDRLLGAGFGSVEVWFQCFNFLSIVALK